CRFHREKSGYSWNFQGATWDLRHIRGLYGRSILFRNNQPLAAQQYQGRQMNNWTEIIYQTRTYNLIYGQGEKANYTLKDSQDGSVLDIVKGDNQVILHRAVPLILLVMVLTRYLDESILIYTGQRKTKVRRNNQNS
ncbi:MAG: hypothetical protein P1S60_20105, partial [Anaerolineae bacterium]|nr:hypothetical protein [Anaerolineae bacterium]